MPRHSHNAAPQQFRVLRTSPTMVGRAPARSLLCLACAIVALSPLLAQTSQDPPQDEPLTGPGPTEVVIVTAPRIDIPLEKNPAATTVLEEKDLQKTRSKTIAADEALKLVPGVKVDNQADGERVHLSIRGQGILTERGIRGIKVLLDGLPLNDPMGFAPDLFDVDWATVQRVEVLRGPASALYGAGSSGGVINIVTRDASPEKITGDASFSLGSYGFWKLFAETKGTAGATAYRISASRMMADGYRVHTAYDAANLYGKFRWNPGSSARLTAIVAGTEYFNENAEGLSAEQVGRDPEMANPDAVPKNEYQKTLRATAGLTGQFSLTRDQELAFSVYFRRTLYRESVPASVIHRTYDTPGTLLQYTLRAGAGWLKNEFSAGTDLGWQSVDEYRECNPLGTCTGPVLQSDETIRQWGVGLFALDRVEMGPEWGVIAGVRWDRVQGELEDHLQAGPSEERSFEKPTGRVGVTWNPNPRHGLYVSWGQGFLPPATEELANNPDAFGGFNTHLVPATSSGEEVGARGALGKRGSFDVAIFRLDTENDFGRYRILPQRPLETFYRNAGSSRRYGLETLLTWYPVDKIATQLAYTYSDFKYTHVTSASGASYEDTWLPNSPRHQGYLDVEYEATSHWVAGASVEGQSRSYVDETNTSWAGGYGLVHLRLAYRWHSSACAGEISFVARNVGDRKYVAFIEPDPDGNSYHPAAARALFLAARFSPGAQRKP